MSLRGRLGRRHFDPGKQVAMIEGHGTSVVVFPCLQCPCLIAEQQFDPNCFQCHGNGRFYPPDLIFATTLLLTNESSERTFQETGTWTSGTIRASVLPGVRLSERDKVRMVDIKDVFGDEVLTKGLEDSVRFSAGVELQIVADRTIIYRPDLDYVLIPPNIVSWVAGGNAPAFGSQYSCRYSAYPEFLVVGDSPRLRVEGRKVQSQEVRLMRLDKITEGTV